MFNDILEDTLIKDPFGCVDILTNDALGCIDTLANGTLRHCGIFRYECLLHCIPSPISLLIAINLVLHRSCVVYEEKRVRETKGQIMGGNE